jgi:shikimate kinase
MARYLASERGRRCLLASPILTADPVPLHYKNCVRRPAHCGNGRAVDTTRDLRNLALIGFMGTGKSSVGRFVAAHLGFEFLDTDDLIEAQAGKTITEIFRDEGEAAFRERERALVHVLATRERTVLATGGGLPVFFDNLAVLKTYALVVCLWASAETLYERVRHHGHRPLLQDGDPLGKMRTLLERRAPFYRQADVLINTEQRGVREVGLQVIHQFHSARASSR